jgi:hypothetical protein
VTTEFPAWAGNGRSAKEGVGAAETDETLWLGRWPLCICNFCCNFVENNYSILFSIGCPKKISRRVAMIVSFVVGDDGLGLG